MDIDLPQLVTRLDKVLSFEFVTESVDEHPIYFGITLFDLPLE